MDGESEAEKVPLTADQRAAHIFLTELRTRIATERLPFSNGDDKTAIKSLVDLFDFARTTISSHFGCTAFADAVLPVLNGPLRAFTSRWHRQILDGVLESRDGSVMFRAELYELQDKLRDLAKDLHLMAYQTHIPDFPADIEEQAVLSGSLDFGIPETSEQFKDINKDERAELRRRRGTENENTPVKDASGLALSGGGIRSASFCLGVCQFLADRQLLSAFDIMSTVSGGGYTGAFINRRLEAGGEEDVASPEGQDQPAIQYLRRRAAFLRTHGLGAALSTVFGLLAGMIVNWSVPAAVTTFMVLLVWGLNTMLGLSFLWGYGLTIGLGTSILALLSYAWLPRTWPKLRSATQWVFWSVAGVFVASFLLQQLYQYFLTSLESGFGTTGLSFAALVATFPVISRLLPAIGRESLRRLGNMLILIAAAIAVPILGIVLAFALYRLADQSIDVPALLQLAEYNDRSWLRDVSGLLILFLFLFFLSATAFWAIDINETGPHAHYRKMLKNTFLAKYDNEFSHPKDLNLIDLEHGRKSPYLLVNAVVNLPDSNRIELRERKGDFFVFSKNWTGSPVVGYRKTERWKLDGKKVGLGTAIATSGAAVAPHMALLSISAARSLLSFVNLRLGLWIKRPRETGAISVGRPSGLQLLKEMFGFGMSHDSDWLLVTDGGHLDNSGVYELLRRRCRFIVAVDASADPDGEFQTLITLIRHARIDLGIEIQCDLNEIRPTGDQGLSPAHGTLCRIVYPEEPDVVCLMLYLTTSMTGDEPELIKAYQRNHTDFPNQPTTDQFFDEHQFEAYRRLGVHAARSLFEPILLGHSDSPGSPSAKPSSVHDWLARLYRRIPPGGQKL